MKEDLQFWTTLIAVFGVFVTLFITMLKFNRNSVTKADLRDTKEELNNGIEAFRLEVNKKLEEIDGRLAEAAADRRRIEEEARTERKAIEEEARADRQRIEKEAAVDREKIRQETSEGFTEAAVDRRRFEEEARAERKAIEKEARTDRQTIRAETSEGFAQASVERKAIEDDARANRQSIRDEARDERNTIEGEIIRQNQNYIEHLAYHNIKRNNPDSDDDDST